MSKFLTFIFFFPPGIMQQKWGESQVQVLHSECQEGRDEGNGKPTSIQIRPGSSLMQEPIL